MRLSYFFIPVLSFIFFGCKDETSSSSSQKTPEFTIKYSTKVNGNEIQVNHYYALGNGDSILVSRLDYYTQGIKLLNKSKNSFLIDTVFLYALGSAVPSNVLYKKDSAIPLTIDTVKFLAGLDALTNSQDPAQFSDPLHPLSTAKNMWWTWATMYRFLIFEGYIKTKGGASIPFSFHTGKSYRNVVSIPTNIILDVNSPKTYTLSLNIEKIFIPTAGDAVLYTSGETQAHGDPTDAELTAKVALNFSKAFSFE